MSTEQGPGNDVGLWMRDLGRIEKDDKQSPPHMVLVVFC